MFKRICTIITLLLLMLSLVACGNKVAKTVDEFTSFMEGKNFITQNVTSTTQTNGLATAVIVALNDNYQVEYFAFKDNESGAGVFQHNKNLFDEKAPTKTLSTELNSSNYNYYSFTSGDTYYMVSRIDNTMIYCVASKEYKDEINNIVDELGY